MKSLKTWYNDPKNDKLIKWTSIIVSSLLVVVLGVFGYLAKTTNDSLSEIPREPLLPEQAATASPKVASTSTTASSSPSLATVTPMPKKSFTSPSHPTVTKTMVNRVTQSPKVTAPSVTVNPDPVVPREPEDAPDPSIKYSTSPDSGGDLPNTNVFTAPSGVKTYLLMGSDSRGEDRGRSDSLMLAYVNADHSKTYLVSFPRDLYVKIPGYAKQKINAAYSYGGAPLTVKTVEEFTGVKVQHAAIVNFNSFISLVDSIGGVTINNPYTGCDRGQNVCWKAGPITLTNAKALQYVRWRKGLPNGDITRSQNQQRVVKAIIGKILSAGTLTNPSRLSNVVSTVSKNVVVDKDLTNNAIISDALSMRMTSSDDVRTITAPIAGYYRDSKYGSVDLVNASMMRELRAALATGHMEEYWSKYRNAPVAGKATVNG